ncbi:MAG: hypothetical protein B6D58_09535 [candidate division Zixibacteria bacterium 4484_95]|nr:MAG: hypothetical protein B6D58_09535 [candidate division Zixibacteria bacterium 4484_95]
MKVTFDKKTVRRNPVPKSIERILKLSGMWKYFKRFVGKETLLKFDKNLPVGGYLIPREKYAYKIIVKKYSARECGGNQRLATILTCTHLVHELGHCLALYETAGLDDSERSAYRLILKYYKNLDLKLKNLPFKLVIKDEKKGDWFVDFNFKKYQMASKMLVEKPFNSRIIFGYLHHPIDYCTHCRSLTNSDILCILHGDENN